MVDYRHQARILALQVLYELDSTTHRIGDILQARFSEDGLYEQFTTEQAYISAQNMVTRLVHGVEQHRARVDALIEQYASEWPFEQLALIDRNILRLAIFELVVDRTEPVNAIINEAVDLARLFGTDTTPRFINGVLGALSVRESTPETDRE